MDMHTTGPDSRTLLTFGGYLIARGFHLYSQHQIEPGRLCQLALLQQGERSYFRFEHDSMRQSFCSAREHLIEIEDGEGFDAAAILIDIRTGLQGYRGEEDLLMLSLFTPDSAPGRYIRCPYEQLRGEVMPSSPPVLIGGWSDLEIEQGSGWVLQGMREFHRDHNGVM